MRGNIHDELIQSGGYQGYVGIVFAFAGQAPGRWEQCGTGWHRILFSIAFVSAKRYQREPDPGKINQIQKCKLQVFNHVEKEAENDETGKGNACKEGVVYSGATSNPDSVLYQGKPYFNHFLLYGH